MRSPGRPTSARWRVRPRWRVAAATALLALATAACAVVPAARLLGAPTAGAIADRAAVAPGTCDVVVYTPPTASAEHRGELCRPATAGAVGPEAVVVLVHGGGGYSGGPEATDVWRDAHLAAGRTTFTITYTLLDRAAPTPTPIFPRPEQNVKAAAQWVRSGAGLTDPVIVVHGFSAGARLGAIVATTAADDTYAGDELWPGVDDGIDGALLFYGYYDGTQFFEAAYYGSTAPSTAGAIAAVDADDPALLIVHGADDSLAPVDDSVALAASLSTAGGSGGLMLIDGADHAFDGYGTAALTPQGRALFPAIEVYLARIGAGAGRRAPHLGTVAP